MAIYLKRTAAGNPLEKRQKKIIDASSSKFTEPVDTKAITTANSKVRRLIRETTTARNHIHDTKTRTKEVITTNSGDETESQEKSMKDMIAKAKEKVQEKRQVDHRNSDITRQRIAARLAINQMVKTVDFDEHLKYHTELQQLGCDFITDEVSCLSKFNLLSRSDYFKSNSVLEKNEIPRSRESTQEMRKNSE